MPYISGRREYKILYWETVPGSKGGYARNVRGAEAGHTVFSVRGGQRPWRAGERKPLDTGPKTALAVVEDATA